jgi:hypothetical protein
LKAPERLDLMRMPERVFMHFTKLVIAIALERSVFLRAFRLFLEDGEYAQLQQLHLDLETISKEYEPYRQASIKEARNGR